MRLVRPYKVTVDNMTSTAPGVGEYNPAAIYDVDARVQWSVGAGATQHEYQSLIAGNTGNPLTDAASWLDVGVINKLRMFDDINGTQSMCASIFEPYGPLKVTVDVVGRIDTIAMLGVVGGGVRVEMIVDGVTVYDEEHSLIEAPVTPGYYSYFFEPIRFSDSIIVTGLPNYADPTIRLTFVWTNTSSITACGTCVIGQSVDLGAPLYGAQAGIQDYSRKQRDDFGNLTLVQRAYAKTAKYTLHRPENGLDSVYAILSEFRAKPAFWIGADDYRMTWIYGWVQDWDVILSGPCHGNINLVIEGLT